MALISPPAPEAAPTEAYTGPVGELTGTTPRTNDERRAIYSFKRDWSGRGRWFRAIRPRLNLRRIARLVAGSVAREEI